MKVLAKAEYVKGSAIGLGKIRRKEEKEEYEPKRQKRVHELLVTAKSKDGKNYYSST